MNDIIKSILPYIGTALGGPLGAVAASVVGKTLGLDDTSVDKVKEVLSGMSSADLMHLKTAEMDVQVKLTELGYGSLKDLAEIEVRAIEAVNKTMQAEAGSEHWPTYSWRPFIGFMFGIYIASMWLLPMYGKEPVKLDADLVAAIGGILGIASYFRGKAKANPDIPPVVQLPFKKG